MSEIKPALTAEEWATYPKVYFRRPEYHTNAHDGITRTLNEGYGVEIVKESERTGMWVWDDSWAVIVQEPDRHKLAAISLYGQPFGFTREDVDHLRDRGENCEHCVRLADRLDALLPPEAP